MNWLSSTLSLSFCPLPAINAFEKIEICKFFENDAICLGMIQPIVRVTRSSTTIVKLNRANQLCRFLKEMKLLQTNEEVYKYQNIPLGWEIDGSNISINITIIIVYLWYLLVEVSYYSNRSCMLCKYSNKCIESYYIKNRLVIFSIKSYFLIDWLALLWF